MPDDSDIRNTAYSDLLAQATQTAFVQHQQDPAPTLKVVIKCTLEICENLHQASDEIGELNESARKASHGLCEELQHTSTQIRKFNESTTRLTTVLIILEVLLVLVTATGVWVAMRG